jgi:hypothetical protein
MTMTTYIHPAPVEHLPGVSLDKVTPTCGMCQTPFVDSEALTQHFRGRACELDTPATGRLPQYPLHGHREGLRANDLVTLHSAFVILAHVGGTAHQAEATQCHGIRVAWGVEWCGSCSRRGVWHD